MLLATVCLAGHQVLRSVGTVEQLATDQASVVVEGVVESDPVRVRPRPGRRVDTVQVVLTLRIEQVTGRGQLSRVSTPVLLVGDSSWLGTSWLQRVRVTGRLAPAQPGDDVVAVLRAGSAPELLAPAPAVAEAAAGVRERFRSASSVLPADAAGLVPALVLGDTSATPVELTDAMTAVGLSHLSAVSGTNVTLVLAFALAVCRVLGLPRRLRPVAATVVLAVFVVLVRPEPSVVRAAVMGVVGLLALGSGRARVGVPALSTAVLVLLCWDPWLARSYGFALSVLATLGLLLFAGPWGRHLGRLLPRRLRGLGPALAVPTAAQLTCAPVVVLLQGSVSLVAIPANLLAGPLVAPATVLGVVTAVVAPVSTTIGSVVVWGAGLPALGIAGIAHAAADLPAGSVPWVPGPPGALLLGALTVLGVLVGPAAGHWSLHRPVAAVGVLALAAGVGVPVSDRGWPLADWRLVVCDIGQGDALVLATDAGHAVLVDTGPDPARVSACLDRLGVLVLDAVVLTHFHADHVAGLPGVLRGRPVREVLVSPVAEPPEQVEQVRDWAGRAGIPVAPLYAGDRLSWPGLQARVWWPERVLRDGSIPNNGSLVMTVEVGELHVALLGDIEREAGRAVLSALRREPDAAGWRVDVLKVAHHGSANRDDRLLDALPAPLAVICVGVDNDYGHPAPSTLLALQARGYRILRTDLDGDIAVGRATGGPLLVLTRGP